MAQFGDIPMRSKVLIIVGIAIFFQLLIALTGLYYLNQTTVSLVSIVDQEAEAIRLAARANALFRELVIGQKNMIIARTDDEVAGYRSDFGADRRNLEKQLESLHKVAGAQSAGQIDTFEDSYRDFLAVQQRIQNLIAGNEDGEAMRLSNGVGREIRRKASAALAQLVNELDAALERRKIENQTDSRTSVILIISFLAATLLGLLSLGLVIAAAIRKGLEKLVAATDAIAAGNLDTAIKTQGRDEIGKLSASIAQMQVELRVARDAGKARDWIKTGLARINDVIRNELDTKVLAVKAISEICEYLEAKVGAFYVADGPGTDQALALLGAYAYTRRRKLSNRFHMGEGLVGQAALEGKQILITDVPEDYIRITSGLGETVPRCVCVTPLLNEDEVKGVIEVATLGQLSEGQIEYLTLAAPDLAVTLEMVQGRGRLAKALEASQQLAEELQAQQEELRAANEELEEQTQRLEESEERLKSQQEELQAANEELEEKNELLGRRQKEIERASLDIEEKAAELALASKYKSEFLANMSHELRTPLNSLLLLAQGLAQNQGGNLTGEQTEAARIIHRSGSDLLNLINEILDLSKIEAGQMTLHPAKVRVQDIADGLGAAFGHLAREKGLSLEVTVGEQSPLRIVTDRQRVEQILRNLVANAIKFTDSGGVTVTFEASDAGADGTHCGLASAPCLAVKVTDTGIGISPEQHKVVFEAFQQADSGTARKYGGTGLGLSISRELARLLGGEIRMQSEPDKGSTFTLYLPLRLGRAMKNRPGDSTGPQKYELPPPRIHQAAVPSIDDDSQNLAQGDIVILIVEDDPEFARLLYDKCHGKGFKCLAAATGEKGLELAVERQPAAVILDLRLPGMDGWAVLAALKEDTRTRHIPVHIVSVEEASTDSLRKGAVGHAVKPLSQESLEDTFRTLEKVTAGEIKRVLVVEDDERSRREAVQIIGDVDVNVDEARNGEQALQALRTGGYHCVVLDLELPDMTGGELLAKLESEGMVLPPVVVHTARDLTPDEEMMLREYADSIIIKDVRSPERLLDEVSLFLHQVVSRMSEKKQMIIRRLYQSDQALKGKRVLIVDDDMGTIFAMAHLLAGLGMTPLKAENGERALKLLDENPDTDLVLMDIMMPKMDGYEAMKRIRSQERFTKLPIIVLTAKAMHEDREKCIAAGANDYLPKPVDPHRLTSMMRVWLYR